MRRVDTKLSPPFTTDLFHPTGTCHVTALVFCVLLCFVWVVFVLFVFLGCVVFAPGSLFFGSCSLMT